MPFGNDAKPTRAYAFGAHVVAGEDAARSEMGNRARLWNALVTLDQERRERRDERLDAWLGISSAERAERQTALSAQFRAARGNADALKSARDTEVAWRLARRPGYQDPDVKADLTALEAEIATRAKYVAKAAPLWWCNRDAVLMSYRQHARDPRPLRYHRAEDAQSLTVRMSGGWPVAALLKGDYASKGYVRLTAPDPDAWTHPSRGERRRRCRTPLRLWIATGEDGPIFLDLIVVLHRPLPADGNIQQVTVTRTPVAGHAHWQVIFTVALGETCVTPPEDGVVALDLGWRAMDDGLRVATWRDGDGQRGEERLPNAYRKGRQTVEALQSARDRDFDIARAILADWLRMHGQSAPDWLLDDTRTLDRWHGISRLAALVWRWGERRFPGDAGVYDELAAWRRHDRHHWEYQANLLEQLIARRNDQYRRFAAHLARTYRTVVIESAAWSKLARSAPRGKRATDPAVQRERAVEDAAQRNRQWVAPATLQGAIKNAVEREGGLLVTVPSMWTTGTCSHCGTQQEVDGILLRHRCVNPECGREWDIDENAAGNLLRSQTG